MASRPKRKFVTSSEREILLQQFYDNIEKNEEQFLGRAFVGDEDSDSEFVQSSDSEIQADDNNEERSDIAVDRENFDADNIVIGEQEELPREQKFKNLDEVLDGSNYIDLPAQPGLSFPYIDARKTNDNKLEHKSRKRKPSTERCKKHFENIARPKRCCKVCTDANRII